MRKIFVVGHQANYANWMGGYVTSKMEDADLVVFTGGEDISPSLYEQRPHPRTSFNEHRDLEEVYVYEEAIKLKIPIIGICRGAQLLCVMNNGILVQDQPNPGSFHMMNTYDGKSIKISSSHHQAAYPFVLPEDEYHILGWTEGCLERHQGQDQEELYPPQECEVVFYPKTNCLGIQGHPEWMDERAHPESMGWLKNLLTNFLNNTLLNEVAKTTCC